MITGRIRRAIAMTIASAWLPCALALDPSLDVSQYAHTAWKIRDGFAKGTVTSFAQTPDGYLWLGTELGLLRFDGVRAVPWVPPEDVVLQDSRIRVLRASRDGTLWIGTVRGLASLRDGKLTPYPQFDGNIVNALVEGREGTLWAGMRSSGQPPLGLLCGFRGGKWQCHGEDGSLGDWVISLHVDSAGELWGAGGNRLWRWNAGSPIPFALPARVPGLNSLSEGPSGELLVATTQGLLELAKGTMRAFPVARDAVPARVFRDRDGALWIGTLEEGLLHVHEGRTDAYGRAGGLSGNAIAALFEDREGNIWVATSGGVDRFRALAAPTYSVDQGLPGVVVSVVSSRDGSMWLSGGAGLYRWHEGRMTIQRVPGLPNPDYASLFEDRHGRIWLGSPAALGYIEKGRFVSVTGLPRGYVDSITEDKDGHLWIGHRDAGLVRLSRDRKVDQFAWTKLGQSGGTSRLASDPVHGGLWLGFFTGGIAHLVDGGIRESYSVREGLGKGQVRFLEVDADGTLWAGTDGGLSRIRDGRITTMDRRNGLPCDAVSSMIRDDDGATWLYMPCGLVRIAPGELATWVAAADRGDPRQTIRPTVLDDSDGIRGIANLSSMSPHAAKARDGKLWLATTDGVTVIDPRRIPFNALPPPLQVEQVVADRKTYEARSPLKLPPLLRDLQIDYTALSFVAPEKVRFRYRLEGRDRDWQDAGNRRQAFYTDLDPGTYRFRVIAANNSGVWNEEGASLDFSVAPAYWQTNWFRALCVLAFMALLWALYQLRVRQLRNQFNMTLDARVGERTRIARDLHDTLLQSFHGLLLRFQTAMDLLPNRAAEAKQVLGSAIDQAAEAITEGRDAVQGLRSSTQDTNDLADALRTLGEQLAADEGAGTNAVLRVEAQGAPRTLHPIVRDEIVRIAGEALRNAFRHADAKRIEVELHYNDRGLRLRVRDDGKGIDPKVLKEGGREGHFGMRGMRERAKLIGGKLTVWSGLDDGTEVELAIPASHAYASSPSTWLGRLRQKLQG